jgi:hypothetical protein
MRPMPIDEASGFARDLYAHVRAAIAEEPRTFYEIVRRCAGAYPALVAEALKASEFVVRASEQLIESSEPTQTRPTSWLSRLEGNPALCSWYFTEATCARLASLRDWREQRIAFLGAPRLFEWFNTESVARDCVLFDADAHVIDHLRHANVYAPAQLIRYDVSTAPVWSGGTFDCVFFDPPWYPEDYPQWLARASQLAPEGTIMFSLFPALTRPTARAEREAILASVQRGAAAATVISAFLEYDVPTFEKAELKAAGVDTVRTWKLADLVVLDSFVWRPVSTDQRRVETWREVDIAQIRIFVGQPRNDVSLSRLLSPLPDGTVRLRSPSRRDPGRVAANVLTSRGCGATTDRPQELFAILSDIAVAVSSGETIQEAIAQADADGDVRELIAQLLGD